jgi:hypothetical protein
MGAALCGFRLMGKWLGGVLSVKMIPQFRQYPATLGFGLMDYGGLALAILFDFQQRFVFSAAAYVVSMGLLAVIFTDILSPHLFGWLFKEMTYDSADADKNNSG